MWKNLPSGQMMFFGLSASGWAAYSVQTINIKYEIWPYVPTDGRRLFNVRSTTKYQVLDVYNYQLSCKHVVTS